MKEPAVARIAISNPETVPVGKYSKEALEAAGLWDAVKGKAINTQNVRQSLDYVARGEVDAGFVYATDAAIMPERVKVSFDVPTKTPITYPIAAVKGNGKEKLALSFVAFVEVRSGTGDSRQVRIPETLAHGVDGTSASNVPVAAT